MTTRGWKCHTRAQSHERLCVKCFVVWPRWRRGSFSYKMVAFLRVLPTRWWHGRIAYKMAAIQNKQNVNKNNVEYILCLQCRMYLVNVMWPPDSSMSDVRHWTVWRSTVTRWTFDSAQRHMMAFWPISEAARSWSCDKITCLCVMTAMSFWHQHSCWTELPTAFTTQITATSSTVLYSSWPVRWCRQRFYSIIITIALSLSQ